MTHTVWVIRYESYHLVLTGYPPQAALDFINAADDKKTAPNLSTIRPGIHGPPVELVRDSQNFVCPGQIRELENFSRFWSGPRFLNLFDPGLGPNFSVRNQPVLVRGSLNKTVKKEFTAESSAILKRKSRFFVLNGQISKATSAVGFDDLARTGYDDCPLNPDGNIRFWNGSFHCRSIPTVENKNNQIEPNAFIS